MPEFRLIPTAELVEPEHAARTQMDDERMNSLVVSIRELGVLEPLLVRPAGESTFEIVAGHRRLLASRIAGLSELPCIVLEGDGVVEAAKIHENLEREDLSPSDEAIFYAELYEQNGEDVDVVAELVRKSRPHVEARLNLIRGDKHVFEALAAGKISIGVAQELNQYVDADMRLFHLDYAVRTGVTVAQARQWRQTANAQAELARPAKAPEGDAPAPTPEEEERRSTHAHVMAGAAPWELDSSTERRPCALCGAPNEAWRMVRKYLCVDCAEHVWTRILAAFRGGGQ